MSRPRVAIVGCGNIADFHVPALREAGADVTVVASRSGSLRLTAFADRHGIATRVEGVEALVDHRDEWDAVVVASAIEPTIGIVDVLAGTGAAMLVEKPV